MKLYNVKNVKGLFETVENCEGRVEMVLPSSNINLNDPEVSELITQVMPEEGIREIEIRTEVKEDVYRLLHFAMHDVDAKSIKAEIRAEKELAKTA